MMTTGPSRRWPSLSPRHNNQQSEVRVRRGGGYAASGRHGRHERRQESRICQRKDRGGQPRSNSDTDPCRNQRRQLRLQLLFAWGDGMGVDRDCAFVQLDWSRVRATVTANERPSSWSGALMRRRVLLCMHRSFKSIRILKCYIML